ncbi:hypothetical protein QTH91_01045 [Variovorax dokdonensis]|uniref:DUF6603 domain-containing protein n=1 Tax=Variovorax dokdonensis TaxID=344883 RepID=A0ABT7N535_9BURK|nr:DUF6603 domain-containing protein [Variovorax dokdonensis]MDM0043056.1 hypothetical protein [Variovorax dokdonensis]
MALKLDPELLDAAKAIGLVKDNGDFDASWFEHVFERATSILSNPAQRKALLSMLDRLAPPRNPPGTPAGEKWHPLLGEQPQGNAYFTVRAVGADVVVGLAGEVFGGPPGGPQGQLRVHVPLLRFGSGAPQLVAGQSQAPLALDLRVELGLSRAGGDAITLAAARVSLRWACATGNAPMLLIVLEGLGLDDGGTRDLALDPAALGGATVEVIGALVKQLLPNSGPAAALRHLLGVLGLDEDPVPPLPMAQLTQGPAALQAWLGQIIDGGQLGTWLGHFGGLVGLPVATQGSGLLDDPRRIRLLALGGNGEFNLGVARADNRLHLSLGLRIAPDGANPPARLEASATLVAIPLAGTGSALALPSAHLLVTAPGGAGPLVNQPGTIVVQRINAGLRWNGEQGALLPTLELLDVTFGAMPTQPRIDLTHADSVVDAAAAGLEAALTALLGGAGAPLLALIGLADPQGAPGAWPHRLDAARLQALATQPTRTLGALHRAMLADATNHWGFMLDELRRLFGLPTAVSGSGTPDAPWFVPLGSTGALAVGLAAYNETPGDAIARLRIGLRAQLQSPPWQLAWRADVLGFDIAADGSADVRLFGGQTLRLAVGPFPALSAQVPITADNLVAQLQWQPGSGLQGHAQLSNLRMRLDGTDMALGTLALPPAVPIDLGNPASLPLPADQLARVASALIARGLKESLGTAGVWAGAMVGLHADLPRLPAGWPTLFDPADPLRIATDPEAALRAWLDRLVSGAAAGVDEGAAKTLPHIARLVAWLQQGLATGAGTPPNLQSIADALPTLRGSGVYADPWCVPIAGSGPAARTELLLWLDPDGAPAEWGAALAGAVGASGDALAMLRAAAPLAALLPPLREALQGGSVPAFAAGLDALARSLEESDGLVPVASQCVDDPAWELGAVVPQAAHHLQPKNVLLISLALDRIEAWEPNAANRVVLLLHPAFAGRDCWDDFIAATVARDPAAAPTSADARHFDLRIEGANPLTVDLDVTAGVSRIYTADLQDDGSGNHVTLSQQIARVAARIAQLRPGARLFIVAHSTAGVAARQFCLDQPTQAAGLVTLGTPHRGAPLTALRDATEAQALRLAGRWIGAMPASPIKDALTLLHDALDGWHEGPSGELPVPSVFPVGSFAPAASVATGGVPALALGSSLGGDAFQALRSGLSALASAASADAPTHLGVGVRAALGERVDSLAAVRLHVRADLVRIALRAGVPEPARPAQALSATLSLEDPLGGYLVGPAQAHLAIGMPIADVRVRALRLALRLTRSSGGALAFSVEGEALDAAFHGPTLPRVLLDDPLAPALVGAAFDRVFNPPPTPGSLVAELSDGLQRIGLLALNAQGRVGFSMDALAALRADAMGFLLPRLNVALAQGWLGILATAEGYRLALGDIALNARRVGGNTRWQLGVAIDRALSSGNASQAPIALALDAGLDLGSASQPMRPSGHLQLSLGGIELQASFEGGAPSLAVLAPPWLDAPFTVLPLPAGNALQAKASELLPRFLVSSAVSRLVEALLAASGAPAARIAALDALILDPVRFLTGPKALGSGGGGAAAGLLDGAKVAALFNAIAHALGQAGPGIALPGGLQLGASGTSAVTFSLGTSTPIGGVLGLAAQLTIDELLHASPGGSVAIDVPAAGAFPGLAVAFGVTGTGQVSLSVTPGGAGAPIQLLPEFSGFGGLLSAAAQSLLPAVLDAVDDALPASALKTNTLAVAGALDLYDAPGGFAAHSSQWRALLVGGSIASIGGGLRGAFITAARTLLNTLTGSTQFDVDGVRLRWTSPALPGVSGTLRVAAGWDAGGPSFRLEAIDWRVDAAPLRLSLAGGFESSALSVSAALGVDLSVISVPAVPALLFEAGGGPVVLKLRPFGAADAGPLEVRLLPNAQVVASDALPAQLAEQWLLPIAVKVIFEATRSVHASVLWSGGPTLGAVLDAAHLRNGTNLPATLPDLPALVTGALQGLLAGLSLPLGDLSIGLSPDAGRLGARLKGKLPIAVGDFDLTLYFGQRPSGPLGDADAGFTLNLFTLPAFAFQPQIKARGVGLGFSNRNEKPLVDTSIVRIGEVAALAFFNVNLFGAFSTSGWGFEAELTRFGLPLGAAAGGGGDGGNPVAASLLSSDGGSAGGDTTAVSPECDIGIRFMAPNDFSLTIGGQSDQALWITVQKQLGPIYIEQIGVQTLEGGNKVGLLLDGGVKISGLAVQVDDLTIVIPIKKLGDASQWGLDLKGMAVSLEAGTVKIAGGLLKNAGPPTSYDGALMVDVAGRGFTAIGSYARPKDELGEYVSFFVFVSLPIPLGGPPYFFVLGLGGGLGINRSLIVPTDLNQIPGFPLVAAIDNSGFANDPMGALRTMGTNMPPSRGGFWLAAGLKFSTFVVVNSTAVIYVALDHGFEVGLLGLSRMSLPAEDFAIAQIELALKARFSTEEGLLSVQAQLTDRSYLFHPSCQLTGGFAFFLWFNTGKFVLTLGGYHKAFSKPPEFPVVPRLGFRWSVSDCVVIKGESYFALTTTCVMAGGRLEASYRGGPVKAWFKCYLDVLVSWDPFYYVFETGIEIGASVDTWLGEIGVSLGATVHVEGPPMFGWVEVEIVVVTIRVEFGDPAREIDYIDDFSVFRDKYLTTGDGRDHPVDVHLRAGLLPTNPPGADPAPGTKEAPWVVGAEWVFESETRAPSNALRWQDADRAMDADLGGKVDLAPMNRRSVTARHQLRIRLANGGALAQALDPDRFILSQRGGNFPEATWRWQDPRKVQAGAANIRRLSGLRVEGVAEIVHRSALVQITDAVDDLPEYALPLPFEQPGSAFFGELIAIGQVAVDLGNLVLTWTPQERRHASATLLASPEFASGRAAVRGQALSALAQRDLVTRSAPARIVPLTTGLTMQAPAQGTPPVFVDGNDTSPRLDAPRLMAVMRQRGTPTRSEPLALRTTVLKVRQAKGAVRMDAPRGKALAGARLHRAAPAQAAAPTRAVQGERSLLHPAFAPGGVAHATAFDEAAKQVMGNGFDVPAGTTHLWQLPETDAAGRARIRLRLSGDGVARIAWLDAQGDVLLDEERALASEQVLQMPEDAAMLAVACLGRVPGLKDANASRLGAGMGDISRNWSLPGGVPAVGWQAGSQLAMVGAHTLLARGASVQTSRPIEAGRRGLLSAGLVRAGEVMVRQTAVETRLPDDVTVVVVQLDALDASAVNDGDLAIACDGGQLSQAPVVVSAGTRRTLVYDALADDVGIQRGYLSISVGSREAWRLAGVIGLPGDADGWGERLAENVPPQLVAPLALSADGAVRVRFEVLPATTRPTRPTPPTRPTRPTPPTRPTRTARKPVRATRAGKEKV